MELTIKDYSDKAIAIYGNTKEIKDRLKELGGRFNPHLRDGAGWVFPKTKAENVRQFIAKTFGVATAIIPDNIAPSQVQTQTQPQTPPPTKAGVAKQPKKQKAATQYTDVICEGFYDGVVRMPNSKVEKFCKQIMRNRDDYFKNNSDSDKISKIKFTFVKVV